MSIASCNGQSEVASGPLLIRKVRLRQGESVGGHTHHFDHTTIFLRGEVAVETRSPDGVVKRHVFRAGDHFLIRAEVVHQLTACDDDVEFWCVYAWDGTLESTQ